MKTGSRRAGLSLGLTAGLAVLACATPRTDEELAALLRRIAHPPADAKVLALNAGTDIEAWVLVTEATSNGPIVPSKRLALGFAEAARRPVRYVVGGPYPQLNDRVLVDAFTICKEARLPGLELMLVSPRPPGEELLAIARDYGATLIHRLYEEDGREEGGR